MPDLRKNPITGEYVCFSEKRSERPADFNAGGRKLANPGECPFCEGNSHLLAETIELSERGNVRAVVNKYPIISESDVFPGEHEVIIDSVSHTKRLRDFTADEIFETLGLIKRRYAELSSKERAKSVQIFKNEGANAGASLSHSHWQIVALPVVPARLERIALNMKIAAERDGRCALCGEYGEKELIISENGACYAITPRVSRFGYEISLRTKEHVGSILGLDDSCLRAMAALLSDSARRINAVAPDADINALVNNPPINSGETNAFHFSIDIFPRRGRVGGFELLSGGAINSVLPENAAKALKNVDAGE